MTEFWLLLLPVAAASGWWFSERQQSGKPFLKNKKNDKHFSRDYFAGLNFLINEQPDKAVDLFIQLLSADSDTVETHLMLGGLFRRRGEVDRAIRIHQNLIARPSLSKTERTQALFALGQDYMSSGMLDRAEKVFLELVSAAELLPASFRYLLDIYQQEKEWENAIKVARQLEIVSSESKRRLISHFYCELAEQAQANQHLKEAAVYLKQALKIFPNARASLLQAKYELSKKSFKTAIDYLKQIPKQNAKYIPETLTALVESYQSMSQLPQLIDYLQLLYEQYPSPDLLMVLADSHKQASGLFFAKRFLLEQLYITPSLMGLCKLIEWQIAENAEQQNEQSLIIWNLIKQLLANKKQYFCETCGFSARELHWQCPGCKQWETFKHSDEEN